jgi:hypothetical protein
MIEKSDVFVSIDGVKSSGKTKNSIARVMNGNNSYIDYEGGKCHYQIILQLEFHLFREIKKINSEEFLCGVIYDDEFLKTTSLRFKLYLVET